ncbi:hypothetical protein NR402_12015 [Acidithiobacillus ferrooxidans]|uniref:hypothetical protein n=1 Tax=Acidithiobacillus ferrooxidans TaxID=920 RepID=UPI00214A9FFA|nr:hypothetical protein [Acidithiobacillus ferrooxidans]MCR2831000.1 hypothetical protein [Acidithiobacillus ferrooxidans]
MAAKVEIEEESDLITLEELAIMLHRNVNTLRVAVSQRPESLPPRVRFPGVQRNYWRRPTVRAWIASFEEPMPLRGAPMEELVCGEATPAPAVPAAHVTPRSPAQINPKKNRVGRPTKAEQMRRKMALA